MDNTGQDRPDDLPLPLAGTTVIAVEQYGAGPFGTMLLGDLGADVIKIENPRDGGDVSRNVGPLYFPDGGSQFFQAFNRNKRSLTLDLKAPEGQEVLHRLVTGADAVLDNLRGDLPARLGLDYAALGKVNPAIVCAPLSAYGREGPRRSWPGYDYLMQAEAGYLALTGEPDGPPARFGLSIVDMMTGLMTVFALVSALHGARRDGIGRDVDVSLFDTALHNLNYLAVWYLNAGFAQQRVARSGHPSLTPSQLYRTGDGWIFIMCNKEKFWPVLAEKLGHPEWGSDPRFATFKGRLEHRDLLTGLLDDALGQRTTAEWLEAFAGAVPAAPVHDVVGALENPFVRESDRIGNFARPEGGADVAMLTSPIRVGGASLPRRAAPAMGADSAEILRNLGYDEKAVERLRDRGVI